MDEKVEVTEDFALLNCNIMMNNKYMTLSKEFGELRDKICKTRLLKMMIKPNKADFIIKIGDKKLFCNRLLLHFHSKHYRASSKYLQTEWDLTSEAISMIGLKKAYAWMTCESTEIDLVYLLPTLQAAMYLRVVKLEECCWNALDVFRGADALILYLEAKRSQCCPVIAQVMLQRIDDVFMQFIACAEYQSIEAEDVRTMTTKHARHSVAMVESFMAMILWLNHNWRERQQHALEFIKTIKFNMFPLSYLMALSTGKDNHVHISNVLKHPGVMDVIRMGIVLKTAFLAPDLDRKRIEKIITADSRAEVKMMWQFALSQENLAKNETMEESESSIEYKHGSCPETHCTIDCPMRHVASYGSFIKFLNDL